MPNYEALKTDEIAESQDSAEDIEERKKRSRKIGAKLLAKAGLADRPIVQRSFERADKADLKPVENGSERRALAHLLRLEAIDEHGGEAVQQLWERAKENIPLPEDEDARQIAEKTLQDYVDFFSAKDCPFPTWFKAYAWDGLTKLRRTTTKKDGISVYQKRDKSSQADFPPLNPAAMALSFDAISRHYGLPMRAGESIIQKDLPPEKEEQVRKIIENGSFNGIYSYEIAATSKPVEVPKNPEDIHGSWQEYTLENVDAISEAAQGTPWCIASKHTAENYFSAPEGTKSQAKFLLFHLTDPDTGLPSKQACASIRLGRGGDVAEISGILDGGGQRLHDSLVEIVHQKAQEYPLDSSKEQAFQDNLELIRLEQKAKSGERFTDDELDFILETRRLIEHLHRTDDPRASTLKGDATSQIIDRVTNPEESDTSPSALLAKLNPRQVIEHLDELTAANVSFDAILSGFDAKMVAWNYGKLKEAGADDDELLKKLSTSDTLQYIKNLKEAGADDEKLLGKFSPDSIVRNFSKLTEAGISEDKIIDSFAPWDIAYYSQTLKNAGADEEKLTAKLSPEQVEAYREAHEDADQQAESFLKKLSADYIAAHFSELQSIGISSDTLINRISENSIIASYAQLKAANVDEDTLIKRLSPFSIAFSFSQLKKAGADEEKILGKLSAEEILENYSQLRYEGADEETLLGKLDASDIIEHATELRHSGTSETAMISRLSSQDIAKNLKKLLAAGIDISRLLDHLTPEYIIENLETIKPKALSYEILDKLSPRLIAYHFPELREAGFDEDELLLRLKPKDITSNLNQLAEAGVSNDKLIPLMNR